MPKRNQCRIAGFIVSVCLLASHSTAWGEQEDITSADKEPPFIAFLNSAVMNHRISEIVERIGDVGFAELASEMSKAGMPLPHPACMPLGPRDAESVDDSSGKCPDDDGRWALGWRLEEQGLRLEAKEIPSEYDPDLGRGGEIHLYRPISYSGDHMVVRRVWSGGGTGWFSSLAVVRLTSTESGLTNETELIEILEAGGDRCNGGIENAAILDGTLRYGIRLTPYDLVNGGAQINANQTRSTALVDWLGTNRDDDESLQAQPALVGDWRAYDDLHACAICCVGEMTVVIGATESKSGIEYFYSAKSDVSRGSLARRPELDQCLHSAIKKLNEQNAGPVPAAAWRSEMLKMARVCEST